ncbi:hypothetical protein QR680_013665 [Steinernema hermaphroditum]|uniref:Uncharacterized protein n=1 Tax=Steinernema hermaphroditum TaxID=289476 RepID=A0AA39I8J6_9BILA|nr:hypothetical protein QR680_013665 [Steinernema hermaphroditum]
MDPVETFLRRINNLHLDDGPKRRFDVEVNAILHVSSQNSSVGIDRICWRGDELVRLDEEEAVDVHSLSVVGWAGSENLLCQKTQPLDSLEQLWSMFSSVQELHIRGLRSGSPQTGRFLPFVEELSPKTISLCGVHDPDNSILQALWNILSKGQTKDFCLVDSVLKPELKDVLLMWVQVTPDWNSCSITDPASQEDCMVMAKLAEEIYGNWMDAEEIAFSGQLFQIKSAHLQNVVPPGQFYEEHRKIRAASAQISVLQDEDMLTMFFFKSDASYVS